MRQGGAGAGAEARADNGHGNGGRGEGSGGEHRPVSSRWEWVLGVLSALLVAGVLGFMVYDGVVAPSGPPRLEVVVDSVRATGLGGYVVEVRVRNQGQSTAAGVLVEGELTSDAGTVETAEATIDYVPAQSQRRAGLVFTRDPGRYALRVRPRGYDLP